MFQSLQRGSKIEVTSYMRSIFRELSDLLFFFFSFFSFLQPVSIISILDDEIEDGKVRGEGGMSHLQYEQP